MARRSHITELGCIACDDLSELGAGREGWLVDNPFILSALDTHSLALASKSLILILGWSGDPFEPRVKIPPTLSPIDAEFISAIEWLVFDDIRVLAVGTSSGYLLIYSLDGGLIHKQLIYPARIMRLRIRGRKKDIAQDISNEEVCIVMEGVLARFDGSDLQNMLQHWFQDMQNNFLDHVLKDRDIDGSFERLPYQLWSVNKYGACADAAITGVMPPPMLEFESSQRYYCAVTVGSDAVISAYRLSEDKSRSLVGAILSKVVPATVSTIVSFSKLIWRSEQSPPKKSEPKTQPFARDEGFVMASNSQVLVRVGSEKWADILSSCSTASPLTCLKDPPRKGEKLTLSPSGTLAAITDSLGRILLLDTQALVVVRLFKGYRDANCLFMEMRVGKDSATTSYHEHGKSDYCLCLAIHAPRKGIIEVWQMRTGPRLLTIPCAKGSKILQPSYRFSSPMGSSSSSFVPLEVFLLNGDSGQLSVINRSLH